MTFKVKDFYYRQAKKESYLARSIYKLEEIDQRFGILHPNDHVLDLGYYPGSWVQYAAKKVGPGGQIVGVDLQAINSQLLPLANVKLWQQDIFQVKTGMELGHPNHFQVILSDMAPSTTGIKMVDQARSFNLVEKVFGLLDQFLLEGGNLVIKIFDSNDAQMLIKKQRSLFRSFHLLRPKSTRAVSKEFFAIGKGFHR